MPTHFLLRSASRQFGIMDVMAMPDSALVALFCRARWPATAGAPVCPRCNMPATGPNGRGRFCCKWCSGQFSVTSGTVFHAAKLPLRKLLLAVLVWATAVKGVSALQMARMLTVQHRTAFVLCHKIRHALLVESSGRLVGGDDRDVEVDGCYIGGHVRPANFRVNRRDRRLARNKNPNRRVVVAARERRSGGRTIVTVVRREADGTEFLSKRLRSGSVVHADEAASWNPLHATHETRRINHQEAYSDGFACTNQAESFFARLRRLERGQHHRISGRYLRRYANEAAYREDHRRRSVLQMTMDLLHLLLTTWPDPEFRGYWQRARRKRPRAGSGE